MIIGLVGLGLKVKNLDAQLFSKTLKINILAEEIGSIQEQNNYLNQNINSINNTFVDLINQSLKEKESLTQETKQLEELKNTLVNSINEKDKAIINLQQQNNQLEKIGSLEQYQNKDLFSILILGENDGLTDTIMLGIINKKNQSLSLISIPRDLYTNGRKINSIYTSYGIEKMINDIYSITGVYADKYAVISLEGFSKMIDILGGIDLYVKKDIYDDSYPADNNEYIVYSIKEGSHHFAGDEALKYVRSRKSTSDFDRSERQQQVVQALRTKLKMLNIVADLNKAAELFKTVVTNVKTNIDAFEAINYLETYQNYLIKSGNVLSPENVLLSSTSLDGQYILLPRNNDFYMIQEEISQLIKM